MTTLAFHLSHSLAASGRFGPEKNVVVTRLDHDANVSPWLRLAETTGVEVRWVPFRKDAACTLDLATFEDVLDEGTALVATGYASNACGTINPIKDLVRLVSGLESEECSEMNHSQISLERCVRGLQMLSSSSTPCTMHLTGWSTSRTSTATSSPAVRTSSSARTADSFTERSISWSLRRG